MPLEIAVASGKGGVGKSTLSSTLILELAEKGYKVVGVDADADAPNLHLIFGVQGWEREEEFEEGFVARIIRERCTDCGVCAEVCPFDAVDLVEGHYVINEVVCEGCATCIIACPEKAIMRRRTVRGYLRKVRTNFGFDIFGARLNPGRPNSGRLVEEIKAMAKRESDQDSIFIVDSAAGIGCQVISSLAGANAAILVAEPTESSFSDLKRVHAVAKTFGLPSALVVNKWDLNPDFVEVLRRYAEEENMELLGLIPFDRNIPLSMARMRPFVLEFPDSPAAGALRGIAARFREEVVDDWDRWRREHLPKRIEPYKPLIIRPSEI